MNDLNDKILCILASMTTENENLVVAKREIIDMTDGALGVEELDKRVEALEVNDMIVLRYSDAESYCLAMRPKGRINAEKIRKAEIAAALAEQEAAREELSARNAELKEQIAAAQALINSLAEDEAEYQKLIKEKEAAAEREQEEIARRSRELAEREAREAAAKKEEEAVEEAPPEEPKPTAEDLLGEILEEIKKK